MMKRYTRQMPFHAEKPRLLERAAIRTIRIILTVTYQLRSIMDNITFGLTMLLVGMGGTLLTLWFLAILIGWLTRFCQSKEEGKKP